MTDPQTSSSNRQVGLSRRLLCPVLLLCADDSRLDRCPPRAYASAWVGLLVASLLWAVASVGIWGLAWQIFGGYDLLIMPPAVFLCVMLIGPFRQAAGAVVRLAGGRDSARQAVVAAAIGLLMFGAMLSMKHRAYHNEDPWPMVVAWARPNVELFRVLLLMPLWGAWAMLISCQFCKVSSRAGAATRAFVAGAGPFAAALLMGALLAVTILYFAFLPWWQLCISGVTIVAAVIGGVVFSRVNGGLDRDVLLATNLVTQIAFMLSYLATVQSF
jgi:hypothetical protein